MYQSVFFSHETNFNPTAGSLVYYPTKNVHYSVLFFRNQIVYQNTQVETGKKLFAEADCPARDQPKRQLKVSQRPVLRSVIPSTKCTVVLWYAEL
jgi:hypothetical protein